MPASGVQEFAFEPLSACSLPSVSMNTPSASKYRTLTCTSAQEAAPLELIPHPALASDAARRIARDTPRTSQVFIAFAPLEIRFPLSRPRCPPPEGRANRQSRPQRYLSRT